MRPLALTRREGRPILLLEDPGGEPLNWLLGQPMELSRFLCLAIGVATALGKKDGRVMWATSRLSGLPRPRQHYPGNECFLLQTEAIGGVRLAEREPKKLNFVEKTRMIFSNRLGRGLGQNDFEKIEGRQKTEICEKEGLEARNDTANSGENI